VHAKFAAQVVDVGRTYFSRIIDTVDSRRAEFLDLINGETFFFDSEPVSLEEFSTDTCLIGGGFFCGLGPVLHQLER